MTTLYNLNDRKDGEFIGGRADVFATTNGRSLRPANFFHRND